MTQTEFAQRLGVSRLSVSDLLHEKRGMTPEMAARVGKLLNTTPESWLRMQQAVDLWEVDQVKPGGDRKFTTEWILYNILEMKFIEGRKVRDVASRLAMWFSRKLNACPA